MTNVVRPAITSRSARLISCSVEASTEEVASSRIEDARIGEDRARDRDPLALAARQRQAALADAACRSPRAARSMNPSAWARAGGRSTSSRVASGRA